MNPYKRTSTPTITFVAEHGSNAVFRVHLAGEEGLNGLLYKGEILEFLMKAGVEHRMGNYLPGIDLPDNPKRKDQFLLIEKAEVVPFLHAFEVSGIHPYYRETIDA